MSRLIDRQNESTILFAAFPEPEHKAKIRKHLFNKFGDKFQPSRGQIVAATKDNGDLFFGRFESGGDGEYIVEGVDVGEIRKLKGMEI